MENDDYENYIFSLDLISNLLKICYNRSDHMSDEEIKYIGAILPIYENMCQSSGLIKDIPDFISSTESSVN